MCSIYGAFGDDPREDLLKRLRRNATDRGRDGGRVEWYDLGRKRAALGNWRATPTPEIAKAAFQPYDRMVHNGTIANDKQLGGLPGEVDSMVLARALDRSSVNAMVASLGRVVGSYALAAASDDRVLLACNYKPLHYWSPDGRTFYFSSMARHFLGVCPWGQAPVALPPYSAIDLLTGQTAEIPRRSSKRAIVIASAGLDSTVVAAKLVADGYDVMLLHFLYGCRAETRERRAVVEIAAALGCKHHFVTIPYEAMGAGSVLTTGTSEDISGAVAGAEYAHEWVPARNLLMLSLAAVCAEGMGYHYIALGNNLEESGAYPDNEEQMTVHMDAAMHYAVQNGYGLRVIAPVGNLMKHEIVKLGLDLGAPLGRTWSCYRGGERHCGVCGPCFMRRTAFERNGAQDPVFEE
jgi:7-cyano-7-deazaguanine synthase